MHNALILQIRSFLEKKLKGTEVGHVGPSSSWGKGKRYGIKYPERWDKIRE